MLSVLVTVHVVKKNKKQPKTLQVEFYTGLCFCRFYITRLTLGVHMLCFFWGMVMNDNEIEAKENKI